MTYTKTFVDPFFELTEKMQFANQFRYGVLDLGSSENFHTTPLMNIVEEVFLVKGKRDPTVVDFLEQNASYQPSDLWKFLIRAVKRFDEIQDDEFVTDWMTLRSNVVKLLSFSEQMEVSPFDILIDVSD